MLQFWRHGYESTSVSDLVAAMHITPPSLYAAFGDKKRLFLEAVHRYLSGPVTSETLIDEAETGREAAAALLRASAIGFTGSNTPQGCLLASSAVSCSAAAADVQRALAALRRGIEDRLREKIQTTLTEEERDRGMDADALAAHTMAVIQGMSTLARDGASRDKLLSIAATAMQAFSER